MSIDYIGAKDEVFGVLNVAFVAAIAAYVSGYTPSIFYPGQVVPSPAPNLIYAVPSFIVVKENQSTLAKHAGVCLYESVSLVALRIFAPKAVPGALRAAEMIGSRVKDAFRVSSPSGEVWFTRQRSTQAEGTDTHDQINVVATCTYKTAK